MVIIVLFGILQFYWYKKGLQQTAQRLDLSLSFELEKLQTALEKDINNIVLPLQVGLKDIYPLYPYPPLLSSIFFRCQKYLPLKILFFIDDKGRIIMPSSEGKGLNYQVFPFIFFF